MTAKQTTTLFRPVGPKELALIRQSGFREFPPRLPGQPIFYPVLNQQYAEQIPRDWNAKDPGTDYSGFVTRIEVRTAFLDRYEPRQVGAGIHQELWVPAEDLVDLNQNIVGLIEVIAEFHGGPAHG